MCETSTTRRRLLPLRFGTMLIAIAVASCIVWLSTDWWSNRRQFVFIATVPGEMELSNLIDHELKDHGIDCVCEGSVAYGVSVRRRDAARARKVLRAAIFWNPATMKIDQLDSPNPWVN